ncbi:MAG: DUF4003 domain-containing protein [Lachnospiraceae bacterium]|nr:DUF4003 domain-containing protein [Lachnospiraceae bacterium]
MKDFIKEKCDLLVKNREAVHQAFAFEYEVMEVAAAFAFTGAGVQVDSERVKEVKKFLRKKKGPFSAMRDVGEALTVARMAASDDYEAYYEKLNMIYEKIKKKRPFNRAYLVLAAANLCESGKDDEIDAIIADFDELDKRMNQEHPFLTGGEDWSVAMLLAISDKSVDSIINEMEECFDYLRLSKVRAAKNGIHGMCQVLTLMDGDVKTKCDKVIELFEKFRAHGVRYGREVEFPALGALADSKVDSDTLVEEIIEAADYLKKHKGFGCLSLNKATRLMFATMVVSEAYEQQNGAVASASLVKKSVLSNALTLAVAAEVAMMIIIVACATSSASN